MKSDEMISMDSMMTTDAMVELRNRNATRVKKLIKSMGTKWVLHPANSPKKIPDMRVLSKT